MRIRAGLLFVFLMFSAQLFADEPSLGPAIEGYGPSFPIDDRDVAIEEGAVYRAVFDAVSTRVSSPAPSR